MENTRMAVFTLETDYPLYSSRQTNDKSQFENGTVLVLDERSAYLYQSVSLSILTDFNGALSVSDE